MSLYSSSVNDSIALEGKYLSNVSDDFLPLLVLQSSIIHLFNKFSDLFPPMYPPPAFLYSLTAAWAFLADH